MPKRPAIAVRLAPTAVIIVVLSLVVPLLILRVLSTLSLPPYRMLALAVFGIAVLVAVGTSLFYAANRAPVHRRVPDALVITGTSSPDLRAALDAVGVRAACRTISVDRDGIHLWSRPDDERYSSPWSRVKKIRASRTRKAFRTIYASVSIDVRVAGAVVTFSLCDASSSSVATRSMAEIRWIVEAAESFRPGK